MPTQTHTVRTKPIWIGGRNPGVVHVEIELGPGEVDVCLDDEEPRAPRVITTRLDEIALADLVRRCKEPSP